MSVTDEQLRAIQARGKVLVSASAGAGKTTVMIKRLADILENGASLDEVLAVTFTQKAAAQMKEKLRAELVSRLEDASATKRDNIRVQLGKINTADISTIHSFCARLIRTYFYALGQSAAGVDASFDVLSDGAEEAALRRRALDELFEKLYSSEDADLYYLLEKLRRKRSDKALKTLISQAYDEVRIRPDYVNLIDGACAHTFSEEGFKEVCAEYTDFARGKCNVLAGEIARFAAENMAPANAQGYAKVLDEMRRTLLDFASSGCIFNPPVKLSSTIKPKVCAEAADFDERFSALCKTVKEKFKALFKDFEDEETERGRFLASGETARAFINLIIAFDEAYSGVKREEGKLDYGDLEHFAYRLLVGGGRDGDVADNVNAKYKYVFVDEYQDVNPIQDAIISAVAAGDIFCVGDVKQAIYGFRGSRSKFFSDKCGEAAGGGEYVVLPDNFRSAKGVINFVNRLFSTIMKPPLSDFDYADGHAMRGGARYKEGYGGVAEICLYDKEDGGKRAAEGVYSVAAQKVAAQEFTAEGLAVLQLVNEALGSTYFDPDTGREERVKEGDICVLTRKRANKSAQGIIAALSSQFTVACAAEVNVCEMPQIRRMLDVLSYLDNAEQDIPLAAALLSPLCGLTESELAAIRVYGGALLFRECAEKYAKELSDGLAEKLNAFFARVERLRKIADSVGAARLIDEIVRESGFVAEFDSEVKLSALRRLQQEAYAPSGELFLNAFLAKLAEGEFKVPAPASVSSDCIKVMTMHASKGLEFPVVIIADISAGFGGDDKNEMPFDEKYGFAPRHYEKRGRAYKNTMLRRVCKVRADREELCNEINLFYVACTRAKYALHVLTGEAEDFNGIRASYAESYADLFDVKAFTPRILPNQSHLIAENATLRRTFDSSLSDGVSEQNLHAATGYEYKFALGVDLPVKSSASRLLSLRDGEDGAAQMFDKDIEEGAKTSVDDGLAYHRFLELCDFGKRSEEEICAQIKNFVARGQMTVEAAARLDPAKLKNILAMPAFNTLSGKRLFREREFVCKLPSADYVSLQKGCAEDVAVGSDDGNGVIVQGAIDLLAVTVEDGRAVAADVIDYKYTAHGDGFVRDKYRPQLALYKSAVCRIYSLAPSAVTTKILNIYACRQIETEV